MALMGNYDTSGVYYQGVVQQIHRLLATIADATRKAKWQIVQHQIVEEFEKVKATSSTLQLFKVDTHGERLLGSTIRIDFIQLIGIMSANLTSPQISGTSCLSFEETTRDPALWAYNNSDSSWNQTQPRDPDVWPPLTPAEQKYQYRFKLIILYYLLICVLSSNFLLQENINKNKFLVFPFLFLVPIYIIVI